MRRSKSSSHLISDSVSYDLCSILNCSYFFIFQELMKGRKGLQLWRSRDVQIVATQLIRMEDACTCLVISVIISSVGNALLPGKDTCLTGKNLAMPNLLRYVCKIGNCYNLQAECSCWAARRHFWVQW